MTHGPCSPYRRAGGAHQRGCGLFNALVAIARCGERRANFFNVGEAAGFESEVDNRVAEADAVIGTVVRGLHNVRTQIGNNFGEVVECAGAVGEMDADAGAAAVFDKAALDDLREQRDVDVAAADENRGSLAVEGGLFLQQRGQGRCSGTLGQSLFPLEQDQDVSGNFLFVDGDKLVDILFDKGKSLCPGATNSNAVGDGSFSGNGDRMAGSACLEHGRQAFSLDADDADLRIAFLNGAGHAADEAAAADGNHDRFQAGNLLKQLEADGPLPGDDRVIVEGVEESEPVGFALANGFRAGLVVVGAVQHDISPVA